MRLAFRSKTKAWEEYLQGLLLASRGYELTLIELRPLDVNQYHYTQHIKGAVRRACNKLNLFSQMVHPMKQNKDGEVGISHQYRARNSVTDLLYRQMGIVYGSPVDLYEKAGIPHEVARSLNVIMLYNLRKNTPKLNYSLAVRLHPSGQMEAMLPQHSQTWLPLLEAQNLLGAIFAAGKKQSIELLPQEQAQFAAHVFTQTHAEPTLVLLDAADWRNYNVLPQFANTNKLKNQVDLRHVKGFEHLYTLEELPNLRIIRLRTIGTSGETPQYFTASDDMWGEHDESKDLNYLAGFIDTQARSDFFHYFSIGQLPKTAKQQYQSPGLYKMDAGGGIAFKHQTIVEFVPFLLQQEDDPLLWCRIPHFLRISPSWDGGNITLPYPMHIARLAIDDQLCILDNYLNEEEM